MKFNRNRVASKTFHPDKGQTIQDYSYNKDTLALQPYESLNKDQSKGDLFKNSKRKWSKEDRNLMVTEQLVKARNKEDPYDKRIVLENSLKQL